MKNKTKLVLIILVSIIIGILIGLIIGKIAPTQELIGCQLQTINDSCYCLPL